MKKVNNILNMVIFLFFGIFVGITYDQYMMFLSDPDFFAPFSAPWYMGRTFSCFLIFVSVALVCAVIKVVIHFCEKGKDRECQTEK